MKAYPVYPQRQSELLDGIWDFAWLGDGLRFEEIRTSTIHYERMMAVPGVFDAGPELAGQRGVGVYRRAVYTGLKAGRMRLRFGGMGLRARVFWDGLEIGTTELAYSGVQFDFDAGEGAHHELVVAVDNRIPENPPILFSPEYDFYGYGGIYRSVEMERLPSAHLNRVQVRTIDLEKRKIRLKISVEGVKSDDLDFTVVFDEKEPVAFKRPVVDGCVTVDLSVPRGKVWSPQMPNLHTVTVAIAGDCITERFGLRTVEARNGRILLNGQPLLLRGLNRHEAHPELGPALPPSIMIEDLQYLRDMGCNFIRGAHYPMNQQFLDLCDQMGFLVWEESLGWGDDEGRISDEHFMDLQEKQTRLMVRNSINHPSVIIWAFLNEACSQSPVSRPLYERLTRAIRQEDSSRLLSYASNRTIPPTSYSPSRRKKGTRVEVADLNFDLVDVISVNLYPGWLSDIDWETIRPLDMVGERLAELAEDFSAVKYKDKPVLISEIGAASLPGCHDRLRSYWSEEYQADLVSEAIRGVFSQDRFSGVAIWQMYDTRTFANGTRKARGFNNAGVLDEYRRPKLAYDVVKELYGKRSESDDKPETVKKVSRVSRLPKVKKVAPLDQTDRLPTVTTNANWRD